MNQADLIEKALQLHLRDRADMADRLLASLDDLSAAELEDLWADEALRRRNAVQQGQLSSVSAGDLMAELKAAFE